MRELGAFVTDATAVLDIIEKLTNKVSVKICLGGRLTHARAGVVVRV